VAGEGPQDDDTILNEDVLLRRVPPWWQVDDGTGTGALRPASGAFQTMTDETETTAMSVLVLRKVMELGGKPEDLLWGEWTDWALVGFPAAVAREKGLRIVWSPSAKEGPFADAHAHVFPKGGGSPRISGSAQNRMVAEHQRFVWPGMAAESNDA
jgi:hypothetical protein